MPEITFTDVPVPEMVRVAKPNPFKPTVEALVKSEKAKSFTMPCKNDAQEKELNAAISQLQRAGRELDVTVRKIVEKNNGSATVTVWTVPRITRTRKPADK